ncbi:PREDICTED: ras-related protein Rab-26-like [Propithecus coquereli]|uniref:ras-related protein Rab-26-like n=1 Tax=Propithecus coquereli TaxID=379532 RepID=UPI00063F8302|nr:PREDICTED: ras-related protein Rab-26-like [Propithecus coquereli]
MVGLRLGHGGKLQLRSVDPPAWFSQEDRCGNTEKDPKGAAPPRLERAWGRGFGAQGRACKGHQPLPPQAWLTEIQEYAQHNVVLMLLGNKVDSAHEHVVKREDGEKLAKEYGLPFMETSAKTGLNVDLAFTGIARELKQRSMKAPGEPRFRLHDYVKREGRGDSCCRP